MVAGGFLENVCPVTIIKTHTKKSKYVTHHFIAPQNEITKQQRNSQKLQTQPLEMCENGIHSNCLMAQSICWSSFIRKCLCLNKTAPDVSTSGEEPPHIPEMRKGSRANSCLLPNISAGRTQTELSADGSAKIISSDPRFHSLDGPAKIMTS